MKKLLTLFLALTTSVGVTYAEILERVQIGNLYYNLDTDSKTAEVTYKSLKTEYLGGSMTSEINKDWNITTADIPASVVYQSENYNVTSIGYGAFSQCGSLSSVTIPDGVTSIEGDAFADCVSLTSIEFPKSITSLGHYIFSGCSNLASVVWNIVEFNDFDYYDWVHFWENNNITSIIFGDDVISIPSMGSSLKKLETITIGKKVKTFQGEFSSNTVVWNAIKCEDLGWNYSWINKESVTSFTFGDAVEDIPSLLCNDMENLTALSFGKNIKTIGDCAFRGCKSLTSIEIPNGVISLGYEAFAWCENLSSISIPNSVTYIGEYAFQLCNKLTSIKIPDGVKSIESFTFAECSALTTVIIGNSVDSIKKDAFNSCTALTSVTFGKSVKDIDSWAFDGCSNWTSVIWNSTNCEKIPFAPWDAKNITSFTFGDDVEIIPANICKGMKNLPEVKIPNSVKRIGTWAFAKCSGLKTIEVPNSITSIEYDAFRECTGLTSITIPSSVTNLGSFVFYGCTGLTSVSIPNTISTIEHATFAECTSLSSIDIPSNVTTIKGSGGLTEPGAFQNCTNLKSVYCHRETPPNAYSAVFDGVDKFQCKLYVPKTSIDMYKNAQVWRDFYNIEVLEDNQAIEEVEAGNVQGVKVVCDGQILILRGDKTYTLQGQEIK